MLNNFIGGGQIFLHKLRMFGQVFFRTFHVSIFLGIFFAFILNINNLQRIDWNAFISYRKAICTEKFNQTINGFRQIIGKSDNEKFYIEANTDSRAYKHIDTKQVMRMSVFKNADRAVFLLFWSIFFLASKFLIGFFLSIFFWWSKFGSKLKEESKKDGSDSVLTAKEVSRKLRALNLASLIKIGNMPIVKDSETRHFLISGSTGSGKTNLFHNILPQIEKQGHPAIVIDQTGEMIAKYYNKERGDIIFNPLDVRSSVWDFWKDCSTLEDLERFSKILFGFNRRQSNHNNDPFWEQSAEVIFNTSVIKLREEKNLSITELTKMVRYSSRKSLKLRLDNTKASRYLEDDGKTTANSILAVLATSTKPLSYLKDLKDGEERFSLKGYFDNIKNGSNAWIFLSSKPSARELTMPLIACLLELALLELMDIGIDSNRRVWFVIDELASLRKLPALSALITEGRKYGAAILAGIQSLNQIYEHYGINLGSTIFGQFGTNFFFRNNEPAICKMISNMCGTETIKRHQKNTSFGANEFRDGVSYNEHEQKKNLVEYSDLANLEVKECYVLLPEPRTRLALIKIPSSKLKDKNEGFISLPEGKDNFPEIVNYDGLENAESLNSIKEESKQKEDPSIVDFQFDEYEK